MLMISYDMSGFHMKLYFTVLFTFCVYVYMRCQCAYELNVSFSDNFKLYYGIQSLYMLNTSNCWMVSIVKMSYAL